MAPLDLPYASDVPGDTGVMEKGPLGPFSMQDLEVAQHVTAHIIIYTFAS